MASIRGWDTAAGLAGGFGHFAQDYDTAEQLAQQQRRQGFVEAGEAAGTPVSEIPASGGGLMGDILRGLHIVPRTTQASPLDIAIQRNAIEDRQLQKMFIFSQMAQRLDPKGMSMLLQQPGMEHLFGGISPEVASHFQTPTDINAEIRRMQLENQAANQQALQQIRQGQLDERTRMDTLMAGTAADRAATARSEADTRDLLAHSTMDYRNRQIEEQADYHFHNEMNNRIKSLGMTNPEAVANINKLMQYYDEARSGGNTVAASKNLAASRLLEEQKAAPPPSSGGSFLGRLGGFGFGGTTGGPAAPTGPSSPTGALPPLPWEPGPGRK